MVAGTPRPSSGQWGAPVPADPGPVRPSLRPVSGWQRGEECACRRPPVLRTKDILTHVTLPRASTSLPLDREHVRRSQAGSDIVGFRRTNRRCGGRLLSPPPAGDLGHVVTIAGDELLMVDELVADRLLGVGGPRPKLRHAVDHVAYQVEAIEIVQHAHVEGCRGGALFLVAAYVNVVMARSPVSQPVNERRVTVEGEDNRLVGSEPRIKIVVREAVGVLARWLQLHQIDDIDDPDLQIGRVSSKE